MKEKLVRAGLVAGLLGSSGCAEMPAAVTTEHGIIYYNGSEKDPVVRAHEAQHWQDYMDDPEFFEKYASDPIFACEAEKRARKAAGQMPVDNHPRCDALKKFQFHSGAIKRQFLHFIYRIVIIFQFHSGAIKSTFFYFFCPTL
jgi:hypothetical protein